MSQDFSYSTLTAGEGLNASPFSAYPNSKAGVFYAQAFGHEDQLQLSVCKLTGTPELSLPAVTFTSDKFYLDLNFRSSGGYTLRLAGPNA